MLHADQIIILEDGRINAVGSHETLLASNQIYQDIYYSQQEGRICNAKNNKFQQAQGHQKTVAQMLRLPGTPPVDHGRDRGSGSRQREGPISPAPTS